VLEFNQGLPLFVPVFPHPFAWSRLSELYRILEFFPPPFFPVKRFREKGVGGKESVSLLFHSFFFFPPYGFKLFSRADGLIWGDDFVFFYISPGQ